jgi:hypothetical protein
MPQLPFRSIFVGAGLTAWALVAPPAGQQHAAAARAPRAPAAAAVRPAPGGLRTGIQVHGRWTIVVRNPDGSVAAKRNFENTLQVDGANVLPVVMSGFAVPGGWGIILGAPAAGEGPCQGGSIWEFLGTAANQVEPMYDSCEIVTSGTMYGMYPLAGCLNFVGKYVPANTCNANLTTSLVNGPLVQYGGNIAPVQEVGLGLSGVATITNSGAIYSGGDSCRALPNGLSKRLRGHRCDQRTKFAVGGLARGVHERSRAD